MAKSANESKGGDKVAAGLETAERQLAAVEASAANLRREITTAYEDYSAVAEARKRETEQWNYDEEKRRQAERDKQAIEDATREAQHKERTATIEKRELAVRTVLKDLLGVEVVTFDRDGEKAVVAALAVKVEAAEKRATAIAETKATKEHETQKKLDAAEASKETSLLKAANERLTSDLEAANARAEKVQGQYDQLASRMGDLSRDAFQAAGGLTSRANGALETAAQGAGGGKGFRG